MGIQVPFSELNFSTAREHGDKKFDILCKQDKVQFQKIYGLLELGCNPE